MLLQRAIKGDTKVPSLAEVKIAALVAEAAAGEVQRQAGPSR